MGDGKDVEDGYKDAMRLARLEQEEARVRRAIEEKERRDREEGKDLMDLDRTPPTAEIEDIARELEAARELAMQANNKDSTSAKCNRRWDVTEPTDENVDPNQPSPGEWSKEALDAAAPKKRRSRWDATPADVVPGETPKRSRWDQTPASASPDAPMVPIIMNAPGFMHEDKHNRYLTDGKLDAVLRAPAGRWNKQQCGDLRKGGLAVMLIIDSYSSHDVRSSGVQMYVH